MKAVFILGSESDRNHAAKITSHLDSMEIKWELHIASAHKNPLKVLEILTANTKDKGIVYVTIAGRSNALSGFVAANSESPTIACPPFADKTDMMVNINSTLQMPSKTPVFTILDTGNCALGIQRLFQFMS